MVAGGRGGGGNTENGGDSEKIASGDQGREGGTGVCIDYS